MSDKKRSKKRGGASYPCPLCKSPTEVRTTRLKEEGVVRNRKCTRTRPRVCGHTFDTVESIATTE